MYASTSRRIPFIFYLLSFILVLSCSPSTDAPPSDEGTVERERVEVSGSISEDAVWERGKEYYVSGDVTVKQGVTLTIEPDVWVRLKKESQSDYYGLTVEGTLMADGGDSTTTILFTPLDKLLYPTGFTSGAAEWARVKL